MNAPLDALHIDCAHALTAVRRLAASAAAEVAAWQPEPYPGPEAAAAALAAIQRPLPRLRRVPRNRFGDPLLRTPTTLRNR